MKKKQFVENRSLVSILKVQFSASAKANLTAHEIRKCFGFGMPTGVLDVLNLNFFKVFNKSAIGDLTLYASMGQK
jgi:hypothetical protein